MKYSEIRRTQEDTIRDLHSKIRILADALRECAPSVRHRRGLTRWITDLLGTL